MTQLSNFILPVYTIRVYDRSGNAALFDRFWGLGFGQAAREVTSAVFTLDAADPRLDIFIPDALVEIWRAVPGMDVKPSLEWAGLFIEPEWATDERGQTTFTAYCAALETLLQRRLIAYPEKSAGARKAGSPDWVVAQYVEENCGSRADATTRLRPGSMPGFAVSAVASGPSTWEGDRSMETVLDVVNELAAFGGFQWRIRLENPGRPVPTLSGQTLFRFETGQLGADRTNTGLTSTNGRNAAGNIPFTFSLEKENVSNLSFRIDRAGEKNVIFATGDINEEERTVYVESPRKDVSPWNDTEANTTGQLEEGATVESLISLAEEVLWLNQQKVKIAFNPRQTPSALYARDWRIFDRVLCKHRGVTYTVTIQKINVRVLGNGAEEVTMEAETDVE